MMEKLLPLSIGLATVALALGYGLGGLGAWTPLIVALGVLWLIGHWRRWGWISSVGFALDSGVAAAGLLLDLGAGWMLFGLVAALTAWDLDGFVGRLRSVERVDQQRDLERRHLRRLLVVDGLGLLLAAAALGIKLELGFGAVLLLGLISILGLSRAIGFLRREGS